MRLKLLCPIALAVLLVSEPASAQVFGTQPVPERSGGWFGLGLGVASSSLSCRICVGDRRWGTSAVMRGGFTLSPQVRMGLEVAGWAKFDEVNQYIGSLTPSAYFYPNPTKGLLVRAGPSVSFFSAQDQEGTEVGTTSFGILIGAGYEIPLSQSTLLVPSVDLMATSFGSLTSGGGEIGGSAGVTLLHLGVGVTFQ